jgi:hypothetical protein
MNDVGGGGRESGKRSCCQVVSVDIADNGFLCNRFKPRLWQISYRSWGHEGDVSNVGIGDDATHRMVLTYRGLKDGSRLSRYKESKGDRSPTIGRKGDSRSKKCDWRCR